VEDHGWQQTLRNVVDRRRFSGSVAEAIPNLQQSQSFLAQQDVLDCGTNWSTVPPMQHAEEKHDRGSIDRRAVVRRIENMRTQLSSVY
jgi:hypothetical protein